MTNDIRIDIGIALDPALGQVIRRARALAELADLDRLELEAISWRQAVDPTEYRGAVAALEATLATVARYEAEAIRLASSPDSVDPVEAERIAIRQRLGLAPDACVDCALDGEVDDCEAGLDGPVARRAGGHA
jgi:hypothetical protein